MILAVFCSVDARTVRCTDAAAAQLTTTIQQLVQLQHAQQAAAGTASPSYPEQAGLRSAKIFDLMHLKYTTFDGPPSKYDDGAFSLKRAIRSSNCDAWKMLVRVERATDEFQEDVVDPQFEGLRMENVSAELYDLLSVLHGRRIVLHTCCGRYVRTRFLATTMREVQPQDHGGAIRFPKVKELKHVEAALEVGGARQGPQEGLWRGILRYLSWLAS